MAGHTIGLRPIVLWVLLHFSLGFWLVRELNPRVAVLSFHGIDRSNNALSISRSSLQTVISALKRAGCNFVSSDLDAKVFSCNVLLTFDDGLTEHQTVLPSILRKVQVPAVAFVPANRFPDFKDNADGLLQTAFHALEDKSLLNEEVSLQQVMKLKQLSESLADREALTMLPWFAIPWGESTPDLDGYLLAEYERVYSVEQEFMRPKRQEVHGRMMWMQNRKESNVVHWCLQSHPLARFDIVFPLLVVTIFNLCLFVSVRNCCFKLKFVC